MGRMMEGPILNKKSVRGKRELRRIQKEAKARYGRVKGSDLRTRIQKLVKLRSENPYVDLVGKEDTLRNCNGSANNLDEFLQMIGTSGLFGMSGSGFPVVKKLATVIHATTTNKICIVNAVECEPALLQDEWLLEHELQTIVEGTEYLAKMIPFDRVILASKQRIYLQQCKNELELCQVPNRYPMGEEHFLVQQVLQRTISKDECPADVGILVVNVQTVLAIAQIMQGRYVQGTKYITVADLRNGQAAIAKVKVGMPVIDVLHQVMPEAEGNLIYTGGGVLFGYEASKEETVNQHTNFIAYGEPLPFVDHAACKKCGKCSSRCPMGIQLHKIISITEKNPKADVTSLGLAKCIECGTCSYVCGAMRNNMKFIRERKELL